MQPASGQAVFKFVLGIGILMIENCHYKKSSLQRFGRFAALSSPTVLSRVTLLSSE
jgi:hypothetical protein